MASQEVSASAELPPSKVKEDANRIVTARVERLLYPVYTHRIGVPRDTFHEARANDELLSALGIAASDVATQDTETYRDALWLGVSRRTDAVGEEWLLRVHPAALKGAVVNLSSTAEAAVRLAAIYLPTNMIESLQATPGRSSVYVTLLSPEQAEPMFAQRVSVALVQSPEGGRSYEGALRSYFRVPRLLRLGEVFSVPCEGVPEQLLEIEAGEASLSGEHPNDATEAGSRSQADADGEGEWIAAFQPGLVSAVRSRDAAFGDPLHGHMFRSTFSFRVQRLDSSGVQGEEATAVRGPARFVDMQHSDLIVQGVCSARTLPYIWSHFYCCQPVPLPAALQEAMKRVIGLLSSSVRTWASSSSAAATTMQLPAPPTPPAILLVGARGCGKRLLLRTACDRLGLHLLEVNCFRFAGNAAAAGGGLEEAMQQLLGQAAKASPAVLCLRRLQAVCAQSPSMSPAVQLLAQRRVEMTIRQTLQRVNAEAQEDGGRRLVILVGSTEDIEELSAPVRSCFKVELPLSRPDEAERTAVLKQLLPAYAPALPGVAPEQIAKLTAGLTYADLRSVCSEMCAKASFPASKKPHELAEQAVKRLQGGSKVSVTLASKVQWADIGGLENAKDEVMNCLTMPLEQADAFGGEKARSGILLFGPPGTGKTLLAKAVATECKVHFLSVKGPELLSMYIGESEKNVRSLFQSARELAPCVLFFDELDSLAPARGRGSDSGGVMDRVVSQLLAELDGIPATVFLIGATNRPDLLDSSLLRPGRLDRMVYLGIAPNKLPLLKAVTRRFELDTSLAEEEVAKAGSLLHAVAEHCPPNLTGADVASLCSEAYSQAQADRIQILDDLAGQLACSVSTLLIFLEAVEKAGGAASGTSPRPSGLLQLYPERANRTGLATPPAKGLCLYSFSEGAHTAHVIANHHHQQQQSASDSAVLLLPVGHAAAQQADTVASMCASISSFWLAASSRKLDCRSLTALPEPLRALHVQVGWPHFANALRTLQPSVPMEELRRYEELGREYQNSAS